MIGLTGKENKIIQLLHRNFEGEGGVPNKTNVLNFLTTKIALPQETAQNLYTLWWLNYQEDGDYSDIEVNRDPKPIITILKDIHSGKLVEEDIPEIYYDEPISFCSGGSYYGSNNLPCVEFGKNLVTLNLERDQWEQTNISGLHEEDLWRYYEAHDHYNSHYEEYENEEFNYANFPDEAEELIKQIAIYAKRNDIVSYFDEDGGIGSEEIVSHLEDLLPKDDFESLRDDWLVDAGYITANVRSKATEDYYEEEIKYDVDRGGTSYSIDIPMDEFIDMVDEQSPTTFSDFLDMEINPEIDLESGYYDSGYWDSDDNEHTDNMIKKLESYVKEFSDGSLVEYHRKIIEFRKILNTFGIKDSGQADWRKGNKYVSKDNRLVFYENEYDLLNDFIKFTYDDIEHQVSMDEFVNWAQGSILDLKESIKKILRKELLK